MPHAPLPARRRARAVVAGGALPLMLVAALPAHAEQAPARYVVRDGDTLTAISAARGVPIEDLMRFNGLEIDSLLHTGDVLELTGAPAAPPAADTVRVRAGEGWWQVARRAGLSMERLQQLNGMTAASRLHPGMELTTSARATAPERQAAPAAATYTVRPNDGWWRISRTTGVDAATLQALNGLRPSTMLHPGMVLSLPGGASAPAPAVPATPTAPATPATPNAPVVRYTVRAGDSPWSIAQRFDLSLARLRELNGLTRSSMLHVGDVLVISDGSVPAPAPAPAPGAAPTVTDSPAENLRRLRAVPQPTPAQMQETVRRTAVAMGVDPALALGHAYTESRFDHAQVSGSNAIGTMQVLPGTGEFASDLVGRELNIMDPEDNVVAGVALIRYLQEQAPSRELGIGAYFEGLGGVLRDGMSSSTRAYVARVNAAAAMF